MTGFAKTETGPGRRTLTAALAAAAAVVAIALAAACAWAQGPVPEGLEYKVEDGEVTITGYEGDAAEVVVPSEIEGHPVTKIGRVAFVSCETLERVVLPDTVTSIAFYAFDQCTSLKEVNIPSGVTEIGSNAFRMCRSLESVVIPEGVTVIENRTFYQCNSLESVVIPDGVTRIGELAFGACWALESVEIPQSVTTLEANAFNACESLESVTIPSGVRTVGGWAFYGCANLKEVELAEGVEGVGDGAFSNCPALETVVVPETVRTVGEGAFEGVPESCDIYIASDKQAELIENGGAKAEQITVGEPPADTPPADPGNPGDPADPGKPGDGPVEFDPSMFSDVDPDAWYVADGWLEYVVETGLMGGYADSDRFGPYDSISRGQVAVMLYRLESDWFDDGLVERYGSTTDPDRYGESTSFSDMRANAYYTAALNWAKDAGIMTGDESTGFTTVRPDAPISREELCVMIARYFNAGDIPETDLDPEALDGLLGMEDVSDWAVDGVSWCIDSEIIGGVDNGDGTFSIAPHDRTWRAAAAKMFTMLHRDVMGFGHIEPVPGAENPRA